MARHYRLIEAVQNLNKSSYKTYKTNMNVSLSYLCMLFILYRVNVRGVYVANSAVFQHYRTTSVTTY